VKTKGERKMLKKFLAKRRSQKLQDASQFLENPPGYEQFDKAMKAYLANTKTHKAPPTASIQQK